jgi:type I restriction enzyme S subunit
MICLAMIRSNIPQGYKQTELGIIPQEWMVKRLGACFSIGHGRDYKNLSNGDIPVYGSGGIICYVGSFLHDGETVCIGRKGTINKPFYYNGPIWTVDTLFYTHSFQSVLPRYVGYLFDSIDWMRYNEATGVPSLTAKTISNIKKAVPPMEEQRKIVEILGIWDEAIEKQNLLIEKLELRKRALMQRLLTGKTRLPGFTEPWQKVKLGEIGIIKKGMQVNKNTLLDIGAYPTINGGIEPSGYSNTYNTDANTITISEGGNSCGFVNFITTKFWCGGHCYSVTPNELTIKTYLFQLLKHKEPKIMSLRVGSGLPNIQIKSLSKLECMLPSLSEQKAIAEVLTTAYDEIAIHSKTLDALRLQKRGLMQQLLTGKTRVKI